MAEIERGGWGWEINGSFVDARRSLKERRDWDTDARELIPSTTSWRRFVYSRV